MGSTPVYWKRQNSKLLSPAILPVGHEILL
jgi:hypothetical protein